MLREKIGDDITKKCKILNLYIDSKHISDKVATARCSKNFPCQTLAVVFKRGKTRQIRGFRLRELEERVLNFAAPLAQIKKEILSQGIPSLQISRSSAASFSHASQSIYSSLIRCLPVGDGVLTLADGDSVGEVNPSGRGNQSWVGESVFKSRSFVRQMGFAFS